jgi:hypothetical protein
MLRMLPSSPSQPHRYLLILSGALVFNSLTAAEPIAIGSRLEPLVDRFLIEKLDRCTHKLHEPKLAGVALQLDAPWEGSFCSYFTTIKDGSNYRLYYRGSPENRGDGAITETTCMAESKDGITWTRPKLGLIEIHGSKDNNAMLKEAPFCHNFSPFIDTNPHVKPEERYKAVAGTAKTGLIAWVSPDGIRWKKMQQEPVFRDGAFDSQNVPFWSESEQCYVLYFRTFATTAEEAKKPKPRRYRTVSRVTSKDFLHWENPQQMDFGDTPAEHLYTNGTHAYFRAPHLYLAAPMRFMPGRKVLTDEQAKELGVQKGYASDCAEVVFMSSRGGNRYDRTFMEAWVRPGTDIGNWASRAGISALGIVPTSPTELSFYKQAHYAQPSTHLLRYTIRTDGFASVNAPYQGGGFTTKTLTFTGSKLFINFSTGATGGVFVEIQDAQGKLIPGFTMDDCVEQIGDEIERTVKWKNGSDLSHLAGEPIKLRFSMRDADLYALRFQ